MKDYLKVEEIKSVEEISDYLMKNEMGRKKFTDAYFKLDDVYTENACFYRISGTNAQNGYTCVYDPHLRSYLFYGDELMQYTRKEAANKIYSIILRDYH